MSRRVTRGVFRPPPVQIIVNGMAVSAYEGESLATALLASGITAFMKDRSGRKRGPFCNMGVCYDCMVIVEKISGSSSAAMRTRSCMTTVQDKMRIKILE